MINPFYLSADIPDEFFCDREKDTHKIISYLSNNNNVTLISPRRMGKTGLINHCFRKPEIKDKFSTLYIDILQTSSLREFVFLFGKAVYENIVPKTVKWIKKFFQFLQSLNGKISFDAVTGQPSFNMMLGEINNPMLTLDEIFKFLNKYDGQCIIAIDEFQQITRYPESNVEAILRSYIQHLNNVKFIFAGSERHIMQEMFFSYSRPFYNSTTLVTLDAIPENLYIDFALRQFHRFGKQIEEEALYRLYREFDGFTYYMQKTLNEMFIWLDKDEICNTDKLRNVILEILEANATKYREILSNIPEKQKNLLYAVAIEGKMDKITSAEFIKKYNLLSASSIQSAMRVLLEKDYITKTEGLYYLTDKFLSLWIKQLYGPGHLKLL